MQPQISVRQIDIPDTLTISGANFQSPRTYINISGAHSWKGSIIHINCGRQTERGEGPLGRIKVDVRKILNGS